MTCDEAREVMSRDMSDHTRGERAVVRKHLMGCEKCRKFVDERRKTDYRQPNRNNLDLEKMWHDDEQDAEYCQVVYGQDSAPGPNVTHASEAEIPGLGTVGVIVLEI